ncbi:MAG: BamA/TamA family outer membrane protein [Deltaproteobacteria bacterium]|nr:BamA/TamA family outer membrane protein [Deltaproteobacteria bacterium]
MRTLLHAVCCLAVAACTVTETPAPATAPAPEPALAYDVVLEGSPSKKVLELAGHTLLTYRLKADGAPSEHFLLRRAREDEARLVTILRSLGHHAASASARVEAAAGRPTVTFSIDAGPSFTLSEHVFLLEGDGTRKPPPLDARGLGSPVGGRALSAPIMDAERAAVEALRRQGFPYAAFVKRSGSADAQAATLTVASTIATGPACEYGRVVFAGLETVAEDYLLTYLPWEAGQPVDTEALAEYQRRLASTDLFKSVSVRIPETAPRDGEPSALPVHVTLEEGPRRRIASGLRYDTDTGPSARASFRHRNLLGANELLLLSAEGGRVEQSLGVELRKPQYRRPGQELRTSLNVEQKEEEAFEALTGTGFVGLSRRLDREWEVGAGAEVELGTVRDGGTEAETRLAAAPAFAAYDGTGDLLDPKRGARFRLDAVPHAGLFHKSGTVFLTLDATGSVYSRLDENARYVAAARGRGAMIVSEHLDSVPANRRLYAGGGESIRGYGRYAIGPLDADNKPVGGRLALEAEGELRVRFNDSLGAVGFVAGGAVSRNIDGHVFDGVLWAAGLGLRYFSAAGPIRVDVAVPLNPRAVDDDFHLYLSMGQAF